MRVSSWNTEGRLSRFAKQGRRGSPEHILEGIEQLDSDVVFLPEAFDGTIPIEPGVEDRLRELGYHLFKVAYNDQGERKYAASIDTHMMLLSRFEITHTEELTQVGGIRNMLSADIRDPESGELIRFFGIHLDDREEEGRLKQVNHLLPLFAASKDMPVVALGDFNAMRRRSLPAHILRNGIVRSLIRFWPEGETKHTLQRMSHMADGETMHRIETNSHLVHTDHRMRMTITPKARGHEKRPSVRLMQIDYIFTSPDVDSRDFTVASDGGSDHRSITATLQIARQKS